MTKVFLSVLILAGVVCGSSCYRHDASNSMYFFSHHLPKKKKYEQKAHYKEMLKQDKQSEPERAKAAEPKTFFPENDI